MRSGPLNSAILGFLKRQRVARMATADASRQPHLIPICFAVHSGFVYTPIDRKPKKVSPQKLRRVRNIRENNRVALLLDNYFEDWKRLRYLIIYGRASVLHKGREHDKIVKLLRTKYRQYQGMALEDRPLIRIRPVRVAKWGRF